MKIGIVIDMHNSFVCGISTDEDPGLRIESFAVINLRGVSTNKTIIYFIAMQTYKELNRHALTHVRC
jgi:hypothetical protein